MLSVQITWRLPFEILSVSLSISPQCIWPQANNYIAPILYIIPLCLFICSCASLILINEEASISCLSVAGVHRRSPDQEQSQDAIKTDGSRGGAVHTEWHSGPIIMDWVSTQVMGKKGGGSTMQQNGGKVGRAEAERGGSGGSLLNAGDGDGWEEEALQIIYTWE